MTVPKWGDPLPIPGVVTPVSRRGGGDRYEIVTIRAAFTGFAGRYVWHCHILEHEDQEMMLPYEVVAP